MKYVLLFTLAFLIKFTCISQNYTDSSGIVMKLNKQACYEIADIFDTFLPSQRTLVLDSLNSLINSMGALFKMNCKARILKLDSQYYSVPIASLCYNPRTDTGAMIKFKLGEDMKNLLLLKYKLQNDLVFDADDNDLFLFYLLLKNGLVFNDNSIWPFEYCYVNELLRSMQNEKDSFSPLPDGRLKIVHAILNFRTGQPDIYEGNKYVRYVVLTDEHFIYIKFY